MPNKKLKWNREELISIVITALFILGFVLVYTDSSNIVITGQTVQDTLLIEHVEISSAISQGISRSDLILFGILPILILTLLFSLMDYEVLRLFRKTRKYLIVKKVVIFLTKFISSLVLIVIALDFLGFKYIEELTSISTADTILFGIIPIIVITLIFSTINYEVLKLFRKTREYLIIKKIFLFLIRYVLSLVFVILILDFLSSKYLRLVVPIISALTTLDIVIYAIIPIVIISLIFALIIYLLMKYVE